MPAKEALRIEIARRERAEKALRKSEARLKECLGLANIGHWEWKVVSDRLTWSDETYRIFGQPQVGRKFGQAELDKLVHPDDRQRRRKALEDALRGRHPYDVEYRILRPDGEVRYIRVRDDVEYDKSGRPCRMFGVVWDITESKQAEALRVRCNQLTAREREVMKLVVEGMLNKQIAARLGKAEITVKIHRRNVMKKMQAASLAELVRFSEIMRRDPRDRKD